MIRDFIERLRAKPYEVRVRILILAVVVSMIVIVGLWVLSLKYTLERIKQAPLLPEEVTEPLMNVKEKTTPPVKPEPKLQIDNLLKESSEKTPFAQ